MLLQVALPVCQKEEKTVKMLPGAVETEGAHGASCTHRTALIFDALRTGGSVLARILIGNNSIILERCILLP